MLKVSEKVFKQILKRKFNSLVGKSCKRLELLEHRTDISDKAKLSLVKDLIKELNYETMRDIDETVFSYNDGTRINVKFTNPNSSK